MQQPTQTQIAYFVTKVREADKAIAVSHYIRTGQSRTGLPDQNMMAVLDWLSELGGIYQQRTQATEKP